jgi:MFS family permease
MHMKTRWSFGSAGMAEGIIDCGLTYFVLIYYSQVLGLPATLAAFAIAIGLAIDAVSDPLIGWWSDHFRTSTESTAPYRKRYPAQNGRQRGRCLKRLNPHTHLRARYRYTGQDTATIATAYNAVSRSTYA